MGYEAQDEKKKAAAPPPPSPDFETLAKENHLSATHTGLISALDARGLDIGESILEGRAHFHDMAFEKNFPLYRFAVSQDTEGNSYLFWKTKDKAERVPTLDDPGVRERVIEAWKTIEARRWPPRRPNDSPPRPAPPRSRSPRFLPLRRTST